MAKESRGFYGSYGLRMNGSNLTLLDGTSLSQNERSQDNVKQLRMLSKLGFRAYSAGLGQVVLPRDKISKQKMITLIARRYSSCFKAEGKGYKFDHECFLKKQIKYLRYILQLKFKYVL